MHNKKPHIWIRSVLGRGNVQCYHCHATDLEVKAIGKFECDKYPDKFTQAFVRSELKTRGLTLSQTDGEFRVAFSSKKVADPEASAYYTNDLQDAYITGINMWNQPS